jgi:DNA-binding CsgD family transcriptional regulator
VRELLGWSRALAYELTAAMRDEMVAKRDRLIAEMRAEGKTQKQIAKELDIAQMTVSNVLARINKNSTAGKSVEAATPVEPEPEPVTEESEAEPERAYKIDVSPYLPKLRAMRHSQALAMC